MRPDEDTDNSVSNTAASEDVGATSSSDMGGLGVSIGGTGGGYDPNYGSSGLASDLGMGAYGTSAISDFSTGDSGRNYFSPPAVDDYSLSTGMTKYGYSVGGYGPNYGITQQPESYSEGARRVDIEEAKTYGEFLGKDLSVIPGYSEKGKGFIGTVTNLVADWMGTPRGLDFTIDPQTNFIGQTIDDRAMMDGIGNLMASVISPIPGMSIDTALVKDIVDEKAEPSMFVKNVFSDTGAVMSVKEFEDKTNVWGVNRDDSNNPKTQAIAKALGRNNIFLSTFLRQAETPPIEPAEFATPYIQPTFGTPVSEMAEGGEVQRMMNGGVAKNITVDIPDVVDLAGQAEEVKGNPDSFFIDPSVAKTADDLSAVYAYNKKIMDVASGKLNLPTPMQQGGEALNGPVGFVGAPPEQVAPEDTVADDVPMDVEEGTFILNASAVEFAGSDDIKKMILNAMQEAERQGIDISTGDNKISREETVSLLVSKGEVVVPKLLAEIIGYDRLNKINNRGKKEVEKRQQQAEPQQDQEVQQPPPQPTNPSEGMTMAGGGIASSTT